MSTMNEDVFWQIIESSKIYDGIERSENIVGMLQFLKVTEINQFEQELRRRIEDANDYRIMALAKIVDGYVSDDSFIYFRCWLIGKGREIYYRTLQYPDSLADAVHTDEVADFEDLLYVALKAVEAKADEDDFEDPRDVAIALGLDYDSFSEPKGKDWIESDLPALYPRLCKKYDF